MPTIALAGCGAGASVRTGAPTSPAEQPRAAPPAPARAPFAGGQFIRPGDYATGDADTDSDDRPSYIRGPESDDTSFMDAFGPQADQATERAVTALVKRYYAAAAAQDGARVCALIAPSLASGLARIPFERGRTHGGCAPAASALMAQQHPQLAAQDPATMTVLDVRVSSDLAMAVVGFRAAPISYITVRHEGRGWRLDALFDSSMD